MLLRACSLLFAAGCAAADRFESPGGVMKPAFSLLDEEKSTAGGLVARLGRGTKSPSNPLFGQTLPWEPRIDNGYANVVFDPQYSTKTPWRLWYDAFTSCNDKLRDDKMRYLHCGGGKRHHGGLYAESADGISWVKPELDSGVTYKDGTGFCCDLKACECKPGTAGAVRTNIYTMLANGNTITLDDRAGVPPAERYKIVGDNLPASKCSRSLCVFFPLKQRLHRLGAQWQAGKRLREPGRHLRQPRRAEFHGRGLQVAEHHQLPLGHVVDDVLGRAIRQLPGQHALARRLQPVRGPLLPLLLRLQEARLRRRGLRPLDA